MKFQHLSVVTALTVSAIAGISMAQSASAGELVKNGSFESTPTPLNNGGWSTYNAIEGWKATDGGKIEIQRGAAGKAFDGSNLLELDSHYYYKNASVLGVFQDLVTEIGKTYTLSFAYSARPGTAAAQNNFSVLFGDGFKQTVQGSQGRNQTLWNNFTTSVTATSALTRLQFNYEGTRDTLGAYIDNVGVASSAEAAPEPTTMAGMALAGIAVAYRKKLAMRKRSA